MSAIQSPNRIDQFPLAVLKNMIILCTSGFGLVVALAWNEVVQTTVEKYINPYLGKDSGLISLLIYAVLMTALAVFVTMQLTRLQHKLEEIEQRAEERRANK
jgi:hypothetical protein